MSSCRPRCESAGPEVPAQRTAGTSPLRQKARGVHPQRQPTQPSRPRRPGPITVPTSRPRSGRRACSPAGWTRYSRAGAANGLILVSHPRRSIRCSPRGRRRQGQGAGDRPKWWWPAARRELSRTVHAPTGARSNRKPHITPCPQRDRRFEVPGHHGALTARYPQPRWAAVKRASDRAPHSSLRRPEQSWKTQVAADGKRDRAGERAWLVGPSVGCHRGSAPRGRALGRIRGRAVWGSLSAGKRRVVRLRSGAWRRPVTRRAVSSRRSP